MFLLPEPPCQSCNQTNTTSDASKSANIPTPFILGILGIFLILIATIALRRTSKTAVNPLWGEHESELEAEVDSTEQLGNDKLKIPEDWSNEQYRTWLEGDMPEGWTLMQWMEFTDEQLALLDSLSPS